MSRIPAFLQNRRNNAVTSLDVVEVQEAAVSQMNSSLKEKFDSVSQSLEEMRVDNLHFYHRLGALCKDVKDSPQTYGEDGFKLLKRALYIHSSTIGQSVKFFSNFTTQELNDVIELNNRSANFRLTWSHIVKLLRVKDKDQRTQLIQRAVQELWDPKKLAEEVKKICGGRQEGAGRPLSIPGGLGAQIRQIKNECEKWIKKDAQVWNGDETNIFMNIQNGGDGVYTEEQLEDLIKVQEAMADIAIRANNDAERCTGLIEQIRVCLAAQAMNEREEEETEVYRETTGTGRRNLVLDDDDFAMAAAAAAGIDD